MSLIRIGEIKFKLFIKKGFYLVITFEKITNLDIFSQQQQRLVESLKMRKPPVVEASLSTRLKKTVQNFNLQNCYNLYSKGFFKEH